MRKNQIFKIFLLVFFMFLFSGCNAEYNLTITEKTFNESLDLFVDKSNLDTQLEDYGNYTYEELFDIQKTNFFPVYFDDNNIDPYATEKQSNVKYYEVNSLENSSIYGMNLKYNFDYKNFYRSNIVKTAYNEITMQNNKDIYTLKTNNKCDAFNVYSLLDTLTINISTDLEIITSNADKVSDNVYTWYITRENYQNKPIRISFDTEDNEFEKSNESNIDNPEKENEKEKEKKESLSEKNQLIIMIGSLVVLIIVICFVVMIKTKRL